jgi:hypothetical protein|tara:strand:+ start:191 stop:322 length:132 start_codon:yes stop_codon:yes gene_type:complete
MVHQPSTYLMRVVSLFVGGIMVLAQILMPQPVQIEAMVLRVTL